MKKEANQLIKKYKKQIDDAITDIKTPGKRYKQIPNIITLIRFLSPIFIIPVAGVGNIPLTIGLAWLFGLTDLIDGFIAKNWNLKSELGADLDAATDKVFAGTLLAASSFLNPILLCNLVLEIIIASINIKQKLRGKQPTTTIIGKYKTWAVFLLGGLGLIAPTIEIYPILLISVTITSILQTITIFSYINKYN